MPMMEKMVQTAKQTVKAMVDSQSARACALPGFILLGSGAVMVFSVLSNRCLRNKKAAHQALASDLRERDYLIGSFAEWRPPLDADGLKGLAQAVARTVPVLCNAANTGKSTVFAQPALWRMAGKPTKPAANA
jgi:hypothetical protein